jgi:hypothetical protein
MRFFQENSRFLLRIQPAAYRPVIKVYLFGFGRFKGLVTPKNYPLLCSYAEVFFFLGNFPFGDL